MENVVAFRLVEAVGGEVGLLPEVEAEKHGDVIGGDLEREIEQAVRECSGEGEELRFGILAFQAERRGDVAAKVFTEVCVYHLDRAPDVLVEFVELLGGNPELLVLARADDPTFELADVFVVDLEARHEPCERAAFVFQSFAICAA